MVWFVSREVCLGGYRRFYWGYRVIIIKVIIDGGFLVVMHRTKRRSIVNYWQTVYRL